MKASSNSKTSSDDMIDFCVVPPIVSERPKAPARRMPKSRTRRRGTIEFMASFLMMGGGKSATTAESNSSNSTIAEHSPTQAPTPQTLRRNLSRRISSDQKPSAPHRRGTMEFLRSSLRHMSARTMVVHGEVVPVNQHTTKTTTTRDCSAETELMNSNEFEDSAAALKQ
jgi:hypothetical protein